MAHPDPRCSPVDARPPLTRRGLLTASAAAIAGTAAAAAPARRAFAEDSGLRADGTTLDAVATPEQGAEDGYRRLVAGPGYEHVVREDGLENAPKASRADTRRSLASFVQFTDLHVLDAQSPMRFEFLHDLTGSAFRPQESLTTQGAVALVERVNSLRRGPHTGRAFDCVVSTGDNTDNHEHIELDWFLAVMNGGEIAASTGDPDRWEGVQSSGDASYWNPADPVRDRYQEVGFPELPDLLERATASHHSPGLQVPWFSVFGNHDDSISGTLPSDWKGLADLYTGSWKFTGFEDPSAQKQLREQVSRAESTRALSGSVSRSSGSTRSKRDFSVTADERRAPFTTEEYIRAHLERPQPVGPAGNGFTEQNVHEDTGYYTFEIAEGVVGIALDSTNRAGFTGGSIGHAQYRWLEDVLERGSSRHYDGLGRLVRSQAEDTRFVVFSHHTPDSMNNLLLEPGNGELRHAGWDVANLLGRFPNVLAWVDGHTHTNEISLHGHAKPERRYWIINTASHVDFPQQARVVEIVDNRDGTLSLLSTLIEADAPYQGDALASLYRELSFNDIHADLSQEGTPQDRNVELLLVAPGA